VKRILVATSAQKILDLLIQDPGTQYLSGEIRKATKTSKAGTNLALRQLVNSRLLTREKRGKVYLYSVDFSHPVVRQLKVLRTVVSLFQLTLRLSGLATRIVLYGSSSRGEDMRNSDVDLLVVANSREAVSKFAKKYRITKKIQLTIKTPLEYEEMQRTDPTFYGEVERGIVLWESRDES
jgi:predicted nucleotidyltransferase